MRKLTLGAALAGAAAMAGLLAPGAQATEVVGNVDLGHFKITGGGGAGNDVVLGTTDSRTITVQLEASDNSGITVADFTLFHGSTLAKADAVLKSTETAPGCKASGTSSVCTRHFTINPRRDLHNSLAGTWKVAVDVHAKDGDYVKTEGYTTFFMQRFSKLTADAAPEPVKKGSSLTVTGKLSRANWDTHDYRGYAGQRGYLEFRTPGTDYYQSLGYTPSSTTGTLSAKVTASSDRYWCYEFRATMTTPGVKATGDFVDVR
ncbi:calcium-binding protein [Streptomyces sp. NPDC021080]|uniref:calcium-binding protein n=1 Tax=Streptomyces sp. NPDC021080 TaxID=3365110 RepID=UPI0037A212E5